MKKLVLFPLLLIGLLLPLTGCGGGGSSSSTAPTNSVTTIQNTLSSGSYSQTWSGGTTAVDATQIIPSATINNLTNNGPSKALVISNNGSSQVVFMQKNASGTVQYASISTQRNAGETDLQFAQRLAASASFSTAVPTISLVNGSLTASIV